ncbi:MAG: RDD family protein [Acidobacteriota bacterium]|nr:RDD family protein [Acidobacteriota bacterium]
MAIGAPPGYSGANALAVQASLDAGTVEFNAADLNAANPGETQDIAPAEAGIAGQTALFAPAGTPPAGKLIPFPAPQGKPMWIPAVAPPATQPSVKKLNRPEQGALDFAAAPPPQKTLRDEVPAQIFCEQTVAAPMHRFVASCVDVAFITLAFGIFVGICQAFGGNFGAGKTFWMVLGAAYMLIAVFYGVIFALNGSETAGMRGAGLQLITFDGNPVEGPARAARVAATMLSFCSGGLGLIWALADEENLTWHDHISKTFPTMADAPGSPLHRGR